jgi:hypothetical protein
MYSIKVTTKCGTLTNISSPSANFSASDTNKAVAARAHKQGALPLNPTAWRDKPLANAMSLGIGSRLQLACHFLMHVEEERLSHIWESQSRGTD